MGLWKGCDRYVFMLYSEVVVFNNSALEVENQVHRVCVILLSDLPTQPFATILPKWPHRVEKTSSTVRAGQL